MDQCRESRHLVDRQSNLVDDDEGTLSTGFLEHNNQYLPQDSSSFSRPYADAGQLGALYVHEPSPNADLTMEGDLNESLAGLGLSGNGGLSNSEISNSILGRTSNIGMNVILSQRLSGTINPMLLYEIPYNRTREVIRSHISWAKLPNKNTAGAHTIPTPPQLANGSESLSTRPYLGHRYDGSSTNLLSPSNTPYRSSTTTQSQYSDSAWETAPPSPSADDFDPRPLPDDNPAFMQIYNDSQSGIWTQEDTHRRGEMFPAITDMGLNNDTNITVTQSIPQELRRFNADADAATFFRAQSHSDGGTVLHNVGHDADGGPRSAALSFTPLSTSGGPVPRFLRPSINGRSGVSTVSGGTLDLGASLAQPPLEVERSSHQLGSNRSSFSNIAPRITVDSPQLPATQTLPTLAASPSPSAGTSAKVVLRCTHRGCQTTFSAKDAQRRHINNIHSNRTKLTCPVCPTVFRSHRRDNVKRHIEYFHPGHPLPAPRSVRKTKSTSKRRR